MVFYKYSDGSYKIMLASGGNGAISSPDTDDGSCIEIIAGNTHYSFLRWELCPNYSWYSQGASYSGWEIGTFEYANDTAFGLSELSFDSDESDNSFLYWMAMDGCHLNCFAMMLANMDMYTNTYKYDVRCGYSKSIFSDPYALVMANISQSDWSTASDGIVNTVRSDNPMYAYDASIESVFPVNIVRYEGKHGFGNTAREKAEDVTSFLSTHPEGIILRFSNHSIVVISSSYTSDVAEEDIDDCFVVFDPGQGQKEDGCGVTLRHAGYSLSDVVKLYYFDSVE